MQATIKTAHTPLPALEVHQGKDYAVIMRPDDTTETALVCVRYPDTDDMRLLRAMAAASDLLTALKIIADDTDDCISPGMKAVARAAIAKAEGR